MSTTESSAAALDPMNVVATEILHHDRSIDWEIVCLVFVLLHVRNAHVNSAVIRTFFIILNIRLDIIRSKFSRNKAGLIVDYSCIAV